jgi:LmbE family N-acetylglucosaminyl deacetylase
MHLFLSPHPDDAILSCGGQIAALVRRGEIVEILTLMAGDPPPNFPGTAFTRELEARWGAAGGELPFAMRRREDQAAAAALGVRVSFLDVADAPYRVDAHHQPLYPDWDAVISTYHPHDDLIFEQLWQEEHWQEVSADALTLHVPLAAGNHVDHRIARDIGRRIVKQSNAGLTVHFYEDYPYIASDPTAAEHASTAFGEPLMVVRHDLTAPDIERKIAAIACYHSQLSTFWASGSEMQRTVRDFTRMHGELEWRLPPKD